MAMYRIEVWEDGRWLYADGFATFATAEAARLELAKWMRDFGVLGGWGMRDFRIVEVNG